MTNECKMSSREQELKRGQWKRKEIGFITFALQVHAEPYEDIKVKSMASHKENTNHDIAIVLVMQLFSRIILILIR